MPKWILCTKRRHSKDDREPVDLKKHKEKVLNKSARSGACSSSDSGCSMGSPVGSSLGEQDPGDPTLELDCKPRSSGLVHVTSTSEDSGEEPLDLSLKDHRSGSSCFSRASEDLESPENMLRRLEMNARRDVVRGVKGHASVSTPVRDIAHQVKPHPYDANLRPIYHHRYQQQPQQQSIFDDQHPLQGTSSERPKLKGKTQAVRKRHLSADCDDEGHVTEALVTPEAVARLERIENKIGGYDCKLCANRYSNAFDLANHNCSGIVKVEHRCPECNKLFQCPANLASHRRWHGLRASNREPSWAPVASPSESKELST